MRSAKLSSSLGCSASLPNRIRDLRTCSGLNRPSQNFATKPLLRQGDAKVFKKYSQMKVQMKREALAKLNRKANDKKGSGTGEAACRGFGTVLPQLEPKCRNLERGLSKKSLVFSEMMEPPAGIEPATC